MKRLAVVIIAGIVGLAMLLAFTQDTWNPEPAMIQDCIKSHTEQVYIPPTYINMDGIMIPVGGGMVDREVCDEYEMIPNPRFIEK